MSLNFTVQKVEEYQGLPDGEYTAQVNNVDYAHTQWGNYPYVDWKILSPSAYEGKVHQERYNIEHENDDVRKIAINNFSKFCIEIGGCEEGDEPKAEDFLYKIATILIKNRISKKDGRSFAGIVKMELQGKPKPSLSDPFSQQMTSSLIPHDLSVQQPKNVEPLNDEVPF